MDQQVADKGEQWVGELDSYFMLHTNKHPVP